MPGMQKIRKNQFLRSRLPYSTNQHQHRRILRRFQSADYADLRRKEISREDREERSFPFSAFASFARPIELKICGCLINKNEDRCILR
jgi:hypothetical protein